MQPRILIAGIGNIFLGDDAFGVEVAQRLAGCALPEDVRVVDFGIRGLDLAYALLDGYEMVILVDAAPRGGRPGTLYVLEVPLGDAAEGDGVLVETHDLDPAKVLRLAASMGGARRSSDPGRLRTDAHRRVGRLWSGVERGGPRGR